MTQAAVGPSDDPCVSSKTFSYSPLATADLSVGSIAAGKVTLSGGQLAGPYALYASYDTTGVLYEPPVATQSNLPLSNALTKAGVCQRIANSCCQSEATEADCNGLIGCTWGPGATNDGGPGCPDPCMPLTTAAIADAGACTSHPGCEYVPTTGYQPVPAQGETSPVQRCGQSVQAFHLVASALTDWGMNFQVDLRQNCPYGAPNQTASGQCAVDASAWDGISFWAYAGAVVSSPGTAVLATVLDHATAGCVNSFVPDNTNLPCGAQGPNGPQCDPFGIAVGLNAMWEFYAIPFSDLIQKGYGPPEAALDVGHLLGFKIDLGKGNWDVWITDISLYKAKAP